MTINRKNEAKALKDKGRLIEASWIDLRAQWLHPDAPAEQVAETRAAFFAGAHMLMHLVSPLRDRPPPEEIGPALFIMIELELQEFIQDFELRHLPTDGSA